MAVIALAALLTVPWSFWVIAATYDRDENVKSAALAERVRFQLSSTWWWNSPQQVLNLMRGELLGDSSVQAVTFLYVRPNEPSKTDAFGYVRRSDSIPIPKSMEDINRLIGADPGSYRKYYTWTVRDNLSGVIYLDLSRAELRKYFKVAYWPVLRNVIALTATGIVVICSVGLFVYQRWGREMQQRQRAELEQQGALAERGLAAAVLAHEIRNPLAALRFQLHSLRRNAADPNRVGSAADTIDAELLRIQQLVQDYLVHEKAQAVRMEAVDLLDAAHNLQTLMSELLKASGTRMVIESPAQGVVVACDPHGLRQVLMNLVLNAQQAMGHGGTITMRIGREEGFGSVAVADTGPGIPEEMRDRLFKPFSTSKKGGSGIGLALVKRFADNYGGTVSVESQAGVGATFHLRLPAVGAVKAEGVDESANQSVERAIT
ncbi:MAG TPA: HAMP domain-containing sensor histidine kinase [Tepidisphaeraceae bacterium]|nr:HAMP domain-containing sensor histidine kinase [Tepidisphaeraceae bacterium]